MFTTLNLDLESSEKKKNVMITKLISLVDTRLLSWAIPPLGGISAFFSITEFADGKWYYGIASAIAFLIVAILANYVKLRIKDREFDVTESANNNNVNLALMKLMQEEHARQSLNEKEFFARELMAVKEFWAKRFDSVLAEERNRCEKEKVYWADREQQVRNDKHDLANKYQPIVGRLDGVILQLRARGIEVNTEGQLIWPDKLRRSRSDDSKIASGEFTLSEE
jgi:hypothetical protein